MNAAAPAPVTTAELLIKRTMATKMATMSNELRTLGRIPPAIRSERRTFPLPLSAVVAIEVFTSKYACSLRYSERREAMDDRLHKIHPIIDSLMVIRQVVAGSPHEWGE